MNRILTLTSSATTASDAAARSDGMSWIAMIGVYVVFFVALYFIFFRPQNKRKREGRGYAEKCGNRRYDYDNRWDLRTDRRCKDENTIVIETGADRSKLQIKRWAIGSVDTVHEDTE